MCIIIMSSMICVTETNLYVTHSTFHVSVWKKLDVVHTDSLKLYHENQKDSPASGLTTSSDAYILKHRRSSSKWNEDIAQAGSTTSETTHAGELISGFSSMSKLHLVCIQLFSNSFSFILPIDFSDLMFALKL